jgi:hypothetical protein
MYTHIHAGIACITDSTRVCMCVYIYAPCQRRHPVNVHVCVCMYLCNPSLLQDLTHIVYIHAYTHVYIRTIHVLTHAHKHTPQGIACITDSVPHRDKLIYSSLLVPGFFAVLIIPPVLAYILYRNRDRETYSKALDYFYFSMLFVTFTAYPAVSRNILSTFACINLGADGNLLRADMRIACPGTSDFSTIWAAIFTCLIPAGIPLILLAVLVAHGVPTLARKKRNLSLLQGLMQTFGDKLDVSGVNDLFRVLTTSNTSSGHIAHDTVALPSTELLESAANSAGISDPEAKQELQNTLADVLFHTYPFGQDRMTSHELITAVDAHRQTSRYLAGKKTQWPEEESVLLVLLAYTVRKLEEYYMGRVIRSRSLFSLISRAHGNPEAEDPKEKDRAHNSKWQSIFSQFRTFKAPLARKDTLKEDAAYYPGPVNKFGMGAVAASREYTEELQQQLHTNAELMYSAKLLSVKQPSWCADESAGMEERNTVQRLGFLFQSYRPYIWYDLICFVYACVCICMWVSSSDETAGESSPDETAGEVERNAVQRLGFLFQSYCHSHNN